MQTHAFQISLEQAWAYEERFVPSLSGRWTEPLMQAATIEEGDSVLDVACGTGVVARAAAARAGPGGLVTGVDLNPAMLEVARRVAPQLTWRQADAASLPFPDDCFDVVTCQAAVFFFPDLTAALREMGRVTRAQGRVVVHSFASLSEQPAYGPWVERVAAHAGPDAVRMLGTYWSQGDSLAMRQRCAESGLRVEGVYEHTRPASFPSVETMVLTEVRATPLGDLLAPETVDRIVAESHEVLGGFVSDGQLVLPIKGYIVVARPA